MMGILRKAGGLHWICLLGFLSCAVETASEKAAGGITKSEPDSTNTTKPFAVFGYLPEWRYQGAHLQIILKHVSHLIFFSLEIDGETGKIKAKDRIPNERILKSARKWADYHGSQLLICFGGNGRSAGFPGMVSDERKRMKFIKSLVKLIKKYQFDGVDYNWEYPGYDFATGYQNQDLVYSEYEDFRLLVKETRIAFRKVQVVERERLRNEAEVAERNGREAEVEKKSLAERITITNTVGKGVAKTSKMDVDDSDSAKNPASNPHPDNNSTNSTTSKKLLDHKDLPWTISMSYYPDSRQEQLLKPFRKHVDFLHSMTYDSQDSHNKEGGHHSSTKFAKRSIDQAVSVLGSNNATRTQQLTVGVPFYGRYRKSGEWITYEDLVNHGHLDKQKDDKTMREDLDSTVIIPGKPQVSYNSRKTIEWKVEQAIDAGLGGVMIWEAGQDCRAAPLKRGKETHVKTCKGQRTPTKYDAEDSLMTGISAAIARKGLRRWTTLKTPRNYDVHEKSDSAKEKVSSQEEVEQDQKQEL